MGRVALEGSERFPPAARTVVRRLRPDRVLEVSLHLGRRPGGALPAPGALGHLDHRELWARHGAHPEARRRLAALARRAGLQLRDVDLGARRAVLRGSVAALSRTFGVELLVYGPGRGRPRFADAPAHHHGHEGPVHVPAELADLVAGVFGLDARPVARPHVRAHRRRRSTPPDVAHYTADQVARLYDFPSALDGAGQRIGIVQLGGGFRRADLAAYFRRVGLPVPKVAAHRVNGARNRPTGRPMSADSEVLLDAEVAGSVAPGAELAVYFAPCDDRGFVDAVKAAVHDRTRPVTVLSLSWGHPEAEWSKSALAAMDEVFQEAAALGITVCASAGDEGATAGTGALAVEFPASSPHVLACGGTRLLARHGRLRRESVWNDLAEGFGATGGGVSERFEPPAFQSGRRVPKGARGRRGRGVPDVAGNADPETGYRIRVDGRWLRLGGTSAVAPLWAGLVARLNQGLGRPLGLAARHLYRLRKAGGLREVTRGSNGGYRARAGWNACTGLGTPRGEALLEALRKRLPAPAGHAAPAGARRRRL